MGERRAPNYKDPGDMLADALAGYEQAKLAGWEQAQKYLENYLLRNHSIPNGVKFFIYDLLAECSYCNKDLDACSGAVHKASQYIAEAQEQFNQEILKYKDKIRYIERGISLAVEQGEFKQAIQYCDKALELGLGSFYTAKKNSILRRGSGPF